MDRRFITVLGVSLMFALVVSTIFYRMTMAPASGAKSEPTDTKDVVIAAKPLPVGVTIKPADLKLAKAPADQFPKGAFSKVDEVIDRPVVSNILMDEPVLEGRLAARGSGLGLAPIIPVGMRAVTVRVSDVVGVAGFVLPGLRVDVLATGRPPAQGSETMTTTVLQNILVLSAGQTIQPDSRGQAINAPTVTLLVTPEQAEILTLAGNEGRIQLVLRNGSDQELQNTPGVLTTALYRGNRPPVKPAAPSPSPKPRPVRTVIAQAAPAPPPPPPPPEVIVIRGNQRSVEVVGQAKTN
ncbi:MAG: Flp pilus assembly protein CpaB [Acidobacteria bacterium]|nr:Flp pilus assembly protein CpaB [Acidobacteriota bacterium]